MHVSVILNVLRASEIYFLFFSQPHFNRDDDDGLVPFSAAFTASAEFYVRSHKLNYGRSSLRMAIIGVPIEDGIEMRRKKHPKAEKIYNKIVDLNFGPTSSITTKH